VLDVKLDCPLADAAVLTLILVECIRAGIDEIFQRPFPEPILKTLVYGLVTYESIFICSHEEGLEGGIRMQGLRDFLDLDHSFSLISELYIF